MLIASRGLERIIITPYMMSINNQQKLSASIKKLLSKN